MSTSKQVMDRVIEKMVQNMQADPTITESIGGMDFSMGIDLTDLEAKYFLGFRNGQVTGGVGDDPAGSAMGLAMASDVFEDMFSGAQDGAALAMSGQMEFTGDVNAGMGLMVLMEPIQKAFEEARASES